jgi:hypothetical protein
VAHLFVEAKVEGEMGALQVPYLFFFVAAKAKANATTGDIYHPHRILSVQMILGNLLFFLLFQLLV